jgi:hypothetical protein
MFATITDAQWAGLSLVYVGIVLMAAMYIRRHVPGSRHRTSRPA